MFSGVADTSEGRADLPSGGRGNRTLDAHLMVYLDLWHGGWQVGARDLEPRLGLRVACRTGESEMGESGQSRPDAPRRGHALATAIPARHGQAGSPTGGFAG